MAKPTKLQVIAANRATRLFRQAGKEEQMEDDDRYRTNMLGKKERYPMTATAELPMRKLNRARAISNDSKRGR